MNALWTRLLLISTFANVLWVGVDGMRAMLSGSFAGTRLTAAEAKAAAGVIVALDPNTYIQYGLWAKLPTMLGIHPHLLAPVFVLWGASAIIALALWLTRRPVGRKLLLGLHAGLLWMLGPIALLALAGVVSAWMLGRARPAQHTNADAHSTTVPDARASHSGGHDGPRSDGA